MDTKRDRGRPLKGDEGRTARVGIRAEPTDKEKWEHAAEKAGLTLSDWIKTRLDRAADKELD